jgi:Pentapeptide repeats (8 copies)
MADQQLLDILQQGVKAWNEWRVNNPERWLDLTEAQLERANLSRAQLEGTDLSEAQLERADLTGAQLKGANLRDAVLGDQMNIGPQLAGIQWG